MKIKYVVECCATSSYLGLARFIGNDKKTIGHYTSISNCKAAADKDFYVNFKGSFFDEEFSIKDYDKIAVEMRK